MKRVLLVEDDALSRRLVTLVLEDMPIELVGCANLADARAALRLANFDLLITDLMLPDGNGAELLAEISADPVLGANLRRIVFSAGVPAAARARFKELGVWLVLDKPVSINALIGCVDDLIGASSSTAAAAAVEPYRSQEAIALHAHFDGNAALFEAFGAAIKARKNG